MPDPTLLAAPPALHRAFGLVLSADAPLPGLPAADAGARADLRVHVGAVPAWLTAAAEARATPDPWDEGSALRVMRFPEHGALLLRYDDGTRFVLDARGREVWAAWEPPATRDDTATYLLGPVLGLALRLRGVLALHGSAVAVEGRAVVLAGGEGAGKSTTAAAFARAGFPVLSDDVVALDEGAGGLRVRPAFPRIRLWPDAAAALFGDADALPRLSAGWDKRRMDVERDGCWQPSPLPLAGVYVLAPRAEADVAPFLTPVAAGDALMALVPHAFAGRLLDAAARGRELEALARLARAVPVRRVTPHASFARLPRLVAALAEDARRLPRPALP